QVTAPVFGEGIHNNPGAWQVVHVFPAAIIRQGGSGDLPVFSRFLKRIQPIQCDDPVGSRGILGCRLQHAANRKQKGCERCVELHYIRSFMRRTTSNPGTGPDTVSRLNFTSCPAGAPAFSETGSWSFSPGFRTYGSSGKVTWKFSISRPINSAAKIGRASCREGGESWRRGGGVE